MKPRIKTTPENVIEIKRPRTTAVGMMDSVHEFIGRFVAYPSEHAHNAHALWCVHAHLMHLWDTTPRIAFLSPEPASGKSRALEVSELLVPNPVLAVNVSPTYLFRKVADEDGPPTILFDEIDTVFGPKAKDNNEEIRGLLNAGHRRGAVAGRCVMLGKTVATEEIPAYSAVALAGLGWLPDTIMSRAVIVRMRRRHHGERIEAFRRRIHVVDGHRIRDRIAAWAQTQTEPDRWPQLPPGVDDRDADVWEPLVAVADMVGGDWPKRARAAAVALIAAAKAIEPSLGIRLLMDLKTVFDSDDALHTTTILAKLIAIEESPWGDLRGKPLDDRGLAKRLREYSIQPDTIRIGEVRLKGYRREALADAWARYVPSPAYPETSVTRVTSVTAQQNQGSLVTAVTDAQRNVTDTPPKITSENNVVTAVTAVTLAGGKGEEQKCAQCLGRIDGTECARTFGDHEVWLHPECAPFWAEGNGWGVRR
jgi:hypothetical protein